VIFAILDFILDFYLYTRVYGAHNSHILTIKKETHRKGSLANKVILFTNQKNQQIKKEHTYKQKSHGENSRQIATKKSHGKSHGK